MIDSQVEAQTILSPYLDTLGDILTRAIDSYKNIDPEVKAVHSARTRTSNISDYIRLYVVQEMAGTPNVSLKSRYGQLRLVIEDKFQLTFKKLDRNLLPSYIPTDRWRDFMNQITTQSELDNMPSPVTNAVVGYQWDGFASARVLIVCPNGRRVEWKLEILPSVTPSIVESTPIAQKKSVVPKVKAKNKGHKKLRGERNEQL